ncbi:MAG TPA: hypothetical protein VM386_02710, partial [Acidimicrobiales bacterium]|nr:hypothetical protein [Acidimicrobiales bacterium]
MPVAVLTNRKKSLPCNSAQPVRQLLGRHYRRRTIASPSHDHCSLAFALAAINAVPLTEHDHAADV